MKYELNTSRIMVNGKGLVFSWTIEHLPEDHPEFLGADDKPEPILTYKLLLPTGYSVTQHRSVIETQLTDLAKQRGLM